MPNKWEDARRVALLKRAADALLAGNRIDPDTGRTQAQIRRQQHERRRAVAARARGRDRRRQRSDAERERLEAERAAYEATQRGLRQAMKPEEDETK